MPHAHTRILIHIIFSTRNREATMPPQLRERLFPYIEGIIRGCGGRPIAVNGTADHIHILLEVPSDKSTADMVRLVKSNSSKWTHETFPMLASFAWQSGYAAFSVSPSRLTTVGRYIADQPEHHRKKSFAEELSEFLDKHGVSAGDTVAPAGLKVQSSDHPGLTPWATNATDGETPTTPPAASPPTTTRTPRP